MFAKTLSRFWFSLHRGPGCSACRKSGRISIDSNSSVVLRRGFSLGVTYSSSFSIFSSCSLLNRHSLSAGAVGIGQRRSIFINSETTPNPHSMKFLPGVEILSEELGTGMTTNIVVQYYYLCIWWLSLSLMFHI